MTLKLVKIIEAGNLNKERIWIKVEKDCQLNDYLLCDNTYAEDGKVTNKHTHMYRFSEKAVKADEYVLLYTKAGKNKTEKRDGVTHHFLYWGMETTVWNQDGDCAHLFQAELVDNFCIKKPK